MPRLTLYNPICLQLEVAEEIVQKIAASRTARDDLLLLAANYAEPVAALPERDIQQQWGSSRKTSNSRKTSKLAQDVTSSKQQTASAPSADPLVADPGMSAAGDSGTDANAHRLMQRPLPSPTMPPPTPTPNVARALLRALSHDCCAARSFIS